MPRPAWRRCSRAIGAALLVTGSLRPIAAQSSDTTQRSRAPVLSDTGFRFHGYVRSGFGVDGTGKGQQTFQAPLAGAKYRLGNEAETYLETTFDYGTVSEGQAPAYFDTRLTLAYVAPTAQSNTAAATSSRPQPNAIARRAR